MNSLKEIFLVGNFFHKATETGKQKKKVSQSQTLLSGAYVYLKKSYLLFLICLFSTNFVTFLTRFENIAKESFNLQKLIHIIQSCR